MNKSTTCPKCGAIDVRNGVQLWACDSLKRNGEFVQSDRCKLVCCEREKQALESRVAELVAEREATFDEGANAYNDVQFADDQPEWLIALDDDAAFGFDIICRTAMLHERGDYSVGIPDIAMRVLSKDQSGTLLEWLGKTLAAEREGRKTREVVLGLTALHWSQSDETDLCSWMPRAIRNILNDFEALMERSTDFIAAFDAAWAERGARRPMAYNNRMTLPLHRKLADSHPALVRGLVRCTTCGRTQRVDSARCLSNGWPKCCGETMRLVSNGAESEARDAR